MVSLFLKNILSGKVVVLSWVVTWRPASCLPEFGGWGRAGAEELSFLEDAFAFQRRAAGSRECRAVGALPAPPFRQISYWKVLWKHNGLERFHVLLLRPVWELAFLRCWGSSRRLWDWKQFFPVVLQSFQGLFSGSRDSSRKFSCSAFYLKREVHFVAGVVRYLDKWTTSDVFCFHVLNFLFIFKSFCT